MAERRPHSILCLAAALLAAPAALSAPAAAQNWELIPDDSHIVFVARQMNATAEGEFKSFDADITFDPDQPTQASIRVVIDVASASTAHPDIEKEIKKEKFFHVEKFPEARFEAASVAVVGEDRYEATGGLTLRGVTKEITLPFALDIKTQPGNEDRRIARATGEVTVKRLDFGIGQAEWKSTGVLANEIVIRIDIVANSTD